MSHIFYELLSSLSGLISYLSFSNCLISQSSRAQILKKASDYIEFMKKKISCHQTDIEVLVKQNDMLEQQLKSLQKTKYTGHYAAMSSEAREGNDEDTESEEDEESEAAAVVPEVHVEPRRKRIKR